MSTTRKTTTPNILDEISAFIRRFVAFPEDHYADVLALWILHSHAFEGSYATPYIYVNSAEPQSGKTRTLEVAELLAYAPMSNARITAAAMYLKLATGRPTMFVDEVDTIFYGAANDELRGVLNSGYKRGGSVTRSSGKRNEDGLPEVETFPTFCPKMLVGIDNAAMPDTLRDRCIDFKLKRKKAGVEVERFIPRKVEPEAEALKAKIEHWVAQNQERILSAPDPKIIEGISDRKFEIAEPLLVLAKIVGREPMARKALTKLLVGEPPKASVGVRTLQAAREIMEEAGSDRIASATLATRMEMTPKKLGTVLANYDITPSTIRFSSGERAKGYHRADFQDAWERYL